LPLIEVQKTWGGERPAEINADIDLITKGGAEKTVFRGWKEKLETRIGKTDLYRGRGYGGA